MVGVRLAGWLTARHRALRCIASLNVLAPAPPSHRCCCLLLQVLELSAENERLKAQLAGLVGSPLNRELQLPPTLLLR